MRRLDANEHANECERETKRTHAIELDRNRYGLHLLIVRCYFPFGHFSISRRMFDATLYGICISPYENSITICGVFQSTKYIPDELGRSIPCATSFATSVCLRAPSETQGSTTDVATERQEDSLYRLMVRDMAIWNHHPFPASFRTPLGPTLNASSI